MTIIRSILFGYLGAILGGLAVAVVAAPLNTSIEVAAAAATVTGAVFGLLGVMWAWRRASTQAVAVPVRRPRR